MKMRNKKNWLDKLYYFVGCQNVDYELCYIWKDEKEEHKSTKWRKYCDIVFKCDFDGFCEDSKVKWFFEKCNQRQVLPNEVVLDLENKEDFPKIIEKLKLEELFYQAYKANKGYHIHLFFDKSLTTKEKLVIIKYFGCDELKNSNRTMISLENEKHWKSGKLKSLVSQNLDFGEIGFNCLNVKNLGNEIIPHLIADIKPSKKKYNGN